MLLCLLLFAFQRTLIFHPARLSQGLFLEGAKNLLGFKEVIEPFSAVVLEPRGFAKGTVVLFHGNAGTALDREMYTTTVLSRGLRLVLAEYPGYGPREGSPSEDALVADAKELYRALRSRYPDGPLLVLGESLGSGVAVRVAAESSPPPDRLVLITPFASMREVASQKAPIFPTHWMVRDKFLSTENLAGYHGPVALLIAENDEVVGAASGKALSEAAKLRSAVQEVLIAGAGHNDWFFKATLEHWDKLLGRVN